MTAFLPEIWSQMQASVIVSAFSLSLMTAVELMFPRGNSRCASD